MIHTDPGKPVPDIPGLSIPHYFYWVLTDPAPLAGMVMPARAWPWAALKAAGFYGLVSLEPTGLDPYPIRLLFAEHLQDLYHGGAPADPARQEELIRQAVTVTVQSLRSGHGVVVHCAGGTGRTGTILGCTLRELGYSADETIIWLDNLHRSRGRAGWPESAWQADLVRRWGRAE